MRRSLIAAAVAAVVSAPVATRAHRDVAIEVDHAFRRWLIGTLQVGYGQDNYVGEGRLDNGYFASLGMIYKLNRDIWLKTEVRQNWLESNFSGASYQSTSVLAGVRLQR